MAEPIDINRQAVIIIHGIGEQRPMQTLRSFLKALLFIDTSSDNKNLVWAKPDKVSKGFEHRRFTMPSSRNRPITDVYELYWAHLFEQSSHSTFLGWVGRIIFRNSKLLPTRYQKIQLKIRFVLAFIFLSAITVCIIYPSISTVGMSLLFTVITLLIGYKINFWLLNYLADAARYLDASARNVKARNEVRDLGIEFLHELHTGERTYDRIIMCGHSLGSVIGYDLLQHFWYQQHESFLPQDRHQQENLEKLSKTSSLLSLDELRKLQRKVWAEQVAGGSKWRVTDFVTLGSPLTYADLLLSDSGEEFDGLKLEGSLALNPPMPDTGNNEIFHNYTYQNKAGKKRTVKILNFNAMFSVVRWTNIYFASTPWTIGDPIAGPIAPLFGDGVRDIKVKLTYSEGVFHHLLYWKNLNSSRLSDNLLELRKALSLDQKRY